MASFISNRKEAFFWAKELSQYGLAGEMNGYIKTNFMIIDEAFDASDAENKQKKEFLSVLQLKINNTETT